MKIYRELSANELHDATRGMFMAVSTNFGWDKVPGIVKSNTGETVDLYLLEQQDDLSLNIDEVGADSNFRVYVEDGFCIETPDGVLWAHDSGGEPEYPGIRVDLVDSNGKAVAGMSMTEYIPGGEGLCSYGTPDAERELLEVPTVRMAKNNGRKLKSKAERPTLCKDAALNYHLTAGFVTRAWADDNHDMDHHVRTFHIGYSKLERDEST